MRAEFFLKMFEELVRVLKPHGSLLIRTASNFGIESQIKFIENGIYKLPDDRTRFLLDAEILDHIKNMKTVLLVEDVKTTIVHNKRAMTTLVIKKQ